MKNHKSFNPLSIILGLIFLLSGATSFSQDYYKPLNIQKAYQNKTRSDKGIPGKAYWQNHADYKINATLNTEDDILFGDAEINYFNNSPDTLKQIVLRLYQDFFREGNARQWPIPTEDIHDGVQITSLIIDGKEYDHEQDFPEWWITNLQLELKDPLPPGKTLVMEIEWNFEIPDTRGLRMKKYDEGHYFIAYWYPQIAVYDDVDGWDLIEYTGMVEFYNDFNNYDVKITAPENYMLWATGDLQNMQNILQPDIIQRHLMAKISDNVVQIIIQDDYKKKNVFAKNGDQTFHFIAEHVPDFSFAASDHANWDGVGLTADSTNGRRILCAAVYPEQSTNWEQVAEISRTSIEYMSFELPGIPYPYSHMTSFCNGTRRGGMETPMMANNGYSNNFERLVGLIFHEISHNYFPFYMGTNERKYAFMDEGWAAYLPHDILEKYSPGYNYMKKQVEGYVSLAGQEVELPLMIPTFQHNSWRSGRIAAYNRPAVAYHMLRKTMGDDMFKKALKEYMKRWNGKHPGPYDFFYTIEDVTGENYYWFFQPWFFESGYPDLAITEVKDGNVILIKKLGNMPVPVKIEWIDSNGHRGELYESPAIWKNGSSTIEFPLIKGIKVKSVKLGSDDIPDIDLSNNSWGKD